MKKIEDLTDSNELSEIPDRLKLELATPLEKFFLWAAMISGFLIFSGFIGYIEDGLTPPAKLMLATGCLFLAVFGGLYFNTDNYYIIDRTGERILYHFKFFFFRKVSTICQFKDISLITTGGKREKSKYSVWWEYAVFILTTDGKLLRITDFAKDAFDKQKSLARKLCDITGAKFISAPEERIVREAGLNSVRHEAHTITDSFMEFGLILLITGAVIAVFMTLFTLEQTLLTFIESAGK